MYSCTIENTTQRMRKPSLHARVTQGELVLLEAYAIKYKNHERFGNQVTVIRDFVAHSGNIEWEAVRTLLKKLQAMCRSEFPGTTILANDKLLTKFDNELTTAGITKESEEIYQMTIITPTF
jgi:hypothetical protein